MGPPPFFWLLFSLFDVNVLGAEMDSVINCQLKKIKYHEYIEVFVWQYS